MTLIKDFHATDAVFRSVLLFFNLLSEFRRVSGIPQHKEPGTLRSQVFLCGALGCGGAQICGVQNCLPEIWCRQPPPRSRFELTTRCIVIVFTYQQFA